jgi:3-hydroxyisobutyrate dehydrogenase-like beta-hydroxyacid dehydrogenase
MKTAVLGLGRMGQEIALRLIDTDHDVTVWNRSAGRAGELVEHGAREADSVEDAVGDAEIVLVSLSGDDAVREVLLVHGSAIDSLRGVVIDCSTVSPATSREVAAAYPDRFVACPIAGAPQAIASGSALLIVGGAPSAVRSAEPALSALSESRHDAGADPGRAASVKLINNYLLMTGLAALADVVALAQALGFDDDAVRSMIDDLPAVAPALGNRVENLISRSHPSAFAVELGVKDLGLFLHLADDGRGLRSELAEAVRARYAATAEQGHEHEDLSAVVETVAHAR